MKFKRTVLLATFVVTMGLLLGTSTAQAAEVIFDPNIAGKAIGITNLDIDGTPYNVAFDEQTPAVGIYGELPGVFDFTTDASASAAVNAVVDELNAENAQRVGEEGIPENGLQLAFAIGYSSTGNDLLAVANTFEGSIVDGNWANTGSDQLLWIGDERTYATFTLAGPAPDPVTIGGSVTGLEGSGLVLQNNGSDDLTITDNGDFTFDTPLTPGNSYNVTVFTNPTNPAQTCSVENGSGQVPTEDVTDVAVSCGDEPEPVTIGGSVTGLDRQRPRPAKQRQ